MLMSFVNVLEGFVIVIEQDMNNLKLHHSVINSCKFESLSGHTSVADFDLGILLLLI